MLKRGRAWIAASVVVLAASAARADLEFAATSSPDDTAGANPLTFTSNSTAVNSDDGVFAFDGSSAAGLSVLDFTVTFSDAEDHLQIVIYTGNVTGAYLGGVIFQQTGATDPSAFALLDASTGALLPGTRNVFTFSFDAGDPYELTPVNGPFTTYTEALLTFNFDNASDALQIDAIANPEPGALALFVLGAAGLGGLAWRKRRSALGLRPYPQV